MGAGYIGLPPQVDLAGETYEVERELRPIDVGQYGYSQAMRRAGVIGAAVLRDAAGALYVLPVEQDGGMDPARLTPVGGR